MKGVELYKSLSTKELNFRFLTNKNQILFQMNKGKCNFIKDEVCIFLVYKSWKGLQTRNNIIIYK